MSIALANDFITRSAWYAALQSAEYSQVAAFADRFYRTNDSTFLKKYFKKWGHPLCHCSRLFEYPYVLAALARHDKGDRIIDIGSGLSFFPFQLASHGLSVTCVDSDPLVARGFKEVSRDFVSPEFIQASADRLSNVPDMFFTAAYSISVIEHIPGEQLEGAMREVRRILKLGGTFVLTFDVSLDGEREISLDKLGWFLDTSARYFTPVISKEILESLAAHRAADDLAATDWFRLHFPSLMPWPEPTFRERYGLNRRFVRRSKPFFSSMAFFCCILQRRD